MKARPWSLVTYRSGKKSEERAGAFVDGRVVELPVAACGVLDLVQRWAEVEPVLLAFDPESAPEVVNAELQLPLRYPRKVLCSGANYYAHMREMKVARADQARPYFFLKPPTTALVGPGEPIQVPSDPSARVDWEAELAVVIGRRARHVSEADALDHVAGYTGLNDISLRGPHRVQHPIGEPFQWDWLASKGADRSTPLGPGIRPAFLLEDPQRLDLRLWVNGELKQNANTSDMVDDVAALIAAASELVTLEPGDVIATGTPDGVGLPRGEFLRPGDLVEMEVGDFGRLSNPVVAELA
ncbi:MAG TPA: fumarylacetoacetate hydrolase family protein [Candidatus Dormibacteraeota bacterium]|nr:fumarylacetoacetate hydrolase family protein [Candidatus Dormibacteraeota bacterium]